MGCKHNRPTIAPAADQVGSFQTWCLFHQIGMLLTVSVAGTVHHDGRQHLDEQGLPCMIRAGQLQALLP